MSLKKNMPNIHDCSTQLQPNHAKASPQGREQIMIGIRDIEESIWQRSLQGRRNLRPRWDSQQAVLLSLYQDNFLVRTVSSNFGEEHLG